MAMSVPHVDMLEIGKLIKQQAEELIRLCGNRRPDWNAMKEKCEAMELEAAKGVALADSQLPDKVEEKSTPSWKKALDKQRE